MKATTNDIEATFKLHPEHDNWLEDCYNSRAAGRTDLIQTFPNYLIRCEAQAKMFDRFTAIRNSNI